MQDNVLQSLEKLKKLPQSKLSALLQLILVIYIAWLIAELTWRLFPQPIINQISFESSSLAKRSSVITDTRKITNLNLFGDFNAEPTQAEAQPEDAPETTLNLKLTGVVPSSVKDLAAAIIEKSGSQDVYGIDEKIDGTRAVIREIFADRVIIEQSGRRETLMLEGQDYNAIVSSSPSNNAVDLQAAQPVDVDKTLISGDDKEALEQIREEAFQDPGKLIDYLKVSPVRRDSELVGYRLYPGKDPQLFKSVGLSAGDIAIEINGYDLTNLSQAMQAMAQLKEAEEASLLVERNGAIKQIYISLY